MASVYATGAVSVQSSKAFGSPVHNKWSLSVQDSGKVVEHGVFDADGTGSDAQFVRERRLQTLDCSSAVTFFQLPADPVADVCGVATIRLAAYVTGQTVPAATVVLAGLHYDQSAGNWSWQELERQATDGTGTTNADAVAGSFAVAHFGTHANRSTAADQEIQDQHLTVSITAGGALQVAGVAPYNVSCAVLSDVDICFATPPALA